MPTKLKVLILEDRSEDAELALHELRRAGYVPEWVRVETEPEYLARLGQDWDIILADYNLPEFSGMRALELLRERDPDFPFIIVSGTIGEDKAVAAMKAGANDYIMKDRLARLGPAVGRELRDVVERHERKRAESQREAALEALRNEQVMLARTEGIAHIGSWVWEMKTDTVTWSNELFRIFQREPREGAPSFAEHPAFYQPDDMARLGQAVEAAVADGTPYELELRAIRKDGETRVCLARGVVEMGPEGRPVRLFGSLQDITERKQTEEALHESEERYRSLYIDSRDAVMMLSPDQGFLSGNPATLKLFACRDEQDFTIRTPASLSPEFQPDGIRSADKSKEMMRLALEKGSQFFEWTHRRADGTDFPATVLLSRLESGGARLLQATVRDITERKRSEEALQDSEEKYRTLVENAAEAILIAQDGMLKFVNRKASEITGYSEQELRSSPFLEFVHPDDRDLVGEHYVNRLKSDVSVPKYAFRLINKDGRTGWMEINAVLVTWEGQLATLNFLSDITERKQNEEALCRAEENYRRSLDDSPLGIRIVSAEGETLYANQAVLDLYGYADIEELRSTPINKRYTPESLAEYQARRKKRMSGEDPPSAYEINIVKKTGEIRCLQASRKTILWNGQPQFQTIYQDITERKKAEEKLQETLGSLRKAFGGITQVLSATTEQRDPYTAGHQSRVADLARAIGQELGLAADQVEGLRLAGTIHDIGKISIPAEILSKPGRLTKFEFDMIQSHAQVGHDILSGIDFVWPIAEMILEHHERMDGSGYPQRLKGEDILLEARILAVADVIEAMASHRPYRASLGIEAALQEISKNKGILYDPEVADACLRLFHEKDYKIID